MLRFANLQTNSHLSILADWMLTNKVFKGEGIQDILVVLCLVVERLLVSHDNHASCLVSLAPLEVVMVKWISL